MIAICHGPCWPQLAYPNSSTNSFTYNALDTRVGKVDSGGTKTYKRDGAGVTDDVLADGASVFTPGVSVRNSASTKFLHGDQLGSFSRETDGTQATTATKQYDAFGMPLSSTGTSVSPFGFAGGWGYQEDSDSGLKLLGHRYYDPSTARFLTRDPAKDGRNWYAYCYDNPTAFVDSCALQPYRVLNRKAYFIGGDPNHVGSRLPPGGGSGSKGGGLVPRAGYSLGTALPYGSPGGVSEIGGGGEALCSGGAHVVKFRMRLQDILNDPDQNADYDHPAATARAAAAIDGSDYHPLDQ